MKSHILRTSRISKVVALATLLLVFPRVAMAYPGFMGVAVGDITSEKVSALKLKEERGVEILSVTPDTPAAQAGLKPRDVVLEFNGAPVDGVEQFQRMVRETPADRTVRLLISRDGATQTVSLKLAERMKLSARPGQGLLVRPPGHREFTVPLPNIELPDFEFEIGSRLRTSRLGIEAQTLGKQLGEYFGAPNGEGVLVVSVERDSVADKAGIKAGDVIVKMDGERVTDTRDVRSVLRDKSEKTSVPVTLLRNKRETTVTVKLEPQDLRRQSLLPRAERF